MTIEAASGIVGVAGGEELGEAVGGGDSMDVESDEAEAAGLGTGGVGESDWIDSGLAVEELHRFCWTASDNFEGDNLDVRFDKAVDLGHSTRDLK